jgi:hypothetical protein
MSTYVSFIGDTPVTQYCERPDWFPIVCSGGLELGHRTNLRRASTALNISLIYGKFFHISMATCSLRKYQNCGYGF